MTFQSRNPSSKKLLHAIVRRPTLADADRIAALARSLPSSERDAAYRYLLLSDHLASMSIVAELEGYVVGVGTAYRKPRCSDTLCVWQIGTVPPLQGHGIGTVMLLELLTRPENRDVRFVEIAAASADRALRRLVARVAQAVQAPWDDMRTSSPTAFADGLGRGTLLRLGPISSRNC